MNQGNPPADLVRDDKFYLDDGDPVIRVNNTLFKVSLDSPGPVHSVET